MPIEKHKHELYENDFRSYGGSQFDPGPPYIIKLMNLPVTVDNMFVEDLFKSRFTSYTKAKIIVDPSSDILNTNIVKKVAFVELNNYLDMSKALKWRDLFYKAGRRVVIEPADFNDFKYCIQFNIDHDQEIRRIENDISSGKIKPQTPYYHPSVHNQPVHHQPVHHQPVHHQQNFQAGERLAMQRPATEISRSKINPFGSAKPVDVVARQQQIDKQLNHINSTTIKTIGSKLASGLQPQSSPSAKLEANKSIPQAPNPYTQPGLSLAELLRTKPKQEGTQNNTPKTTPIIKPTILKKKPKPEPEQQEITTIDGNIDGTSQTDKRNPNENEILKEKQNEPRGKQIETKVTDAVSKDSKNVEKEIKPESTRRARSNFKLKLNEDKRHKSRVVLLHDKEPETNKNFKKRYENETKPNIVVEPIPTPNSNFINSKKESSEVYGDRVDELGTSTRFKSRERAGRLKGDFKSRRETGTNRPRGQSKQEPKLEVSKEEEHQLKEVNDEEPNNKETKGKLFTHSKNNREREHKESVPFNHDVSKDSAKNSGKELQSGEVAKDMSNTNNESKSDEIDKPLINEKSKGLKEESKGFKKELRSQKKSKASKSVKSSKINTKTRPKTESPKIEAQDRTPDKETEPHKISEPKEDKSPKTEAKITKREMENSNKEPHDPKTEIKETADNSNVQFPKETDQTLTRTTRDRKKFLTKKRVRTYHNLSYVRNKGNNDTKGDQRPPDDK